MKKSLLFVPALFFALVIKAQTWNGNTNTDWNTASNWSTNAVPLATGSVTIPNTVNKPVFASNVTLAALTMNLGSALNFNGFTLSLNGSIDINGATLNNTNAATDITITLSGTGVLYFRQNTVNDNIIINHNNASVFYEGYQFPNTFNGNATFNIGGDGSFYTCYDNASTFNGSVTINRTVAGPTYIFNNGANAVTGNFSYTNNAGGLTNIHSSGANVLTTVAGTINITATGTGNPEFLMRRIRNQTTGGTISVQNSGLVTITNDTLLLTAMNVNGFTGAGTDDFFQNLITGTLNISDAADNTGSVYFRGNNITGNIIYTNNGNTIFYEGYQFADTFNGNATFNNNGNGTFYTSYDNVSTFNGNVAINRTVAGPTYIFNIGATTVNGNFSYTNNAGGLTQIHPGGANVLTTITGTINITATGSGNPEFLMRRIRNQTTGGTISVQNSGLVTISYDTLLLTTLNVNGFTGGGIDDFLQNSVSGAINISDASANTGDVYFRGNNIVGNIIYTNNGNGVFYEGYQFPDTFNGNSTFNSNGAGIFYTSYDNVSTFNGNVTINRTVAGPTYIFNNGATAVNGNFSYTNNAGGLTHIHPGGANVLTTITGTINITATGSGNPEFLMRRISNQTTGGTISVQNSGLITLTNDTLLMTAMNINGFTGGGIDDFLQNSITGTVSISDDVTNTGAVYFRRNLINGNISYSHNSPDILYESFQGSNIYNGNLTLTRTAGTISSSYDSPIIINQNLILNATTGISFTDSVIFRGNANGIVEQLGTQPIIMPSILIEKTGSGNVTINDSVTVSNKLTFTGGNIISSSNNQLKFLDNATHSGSSLTSKVVGKVTKVGDDAFSFPIGTATTLNVVSMTAPVGVTAVFGAQYFKTDPTSNGYDTAQHVASLQRVSGCEYWDVRRENGADNVTLTFSFAPACSGDSMYVSNPAQLRIARWTGTAWEDVGNGGSTGSTTGTVTTAGLVNNFGPFTFGSTDTIVNPLPVNLLNFTAAKKNDKVQLQWETNNEINTAHFDIEKSTDGINFFSIAIVNAVNVAGTHYYTGMDVSPIKGKNYYRLKMVDLDGRFTQSRVIRIDFSVLNDISVYPNPGKDVVFIFNTAGYKRFRILDFTGKIIFEKNITSDKEKVNITSLAVGTYLVQLVNDKKIITTKFIKE